MRRDAGWLVPDGHPPLDVTEVHVWLARVDAQSEFERALCATLSPAERARANRFHAARDRRRFVIAHGLLRLLLGRYVGEDPADLVFGVGAYGKPFLLGLDSRRRPAFNLSHAGDLVLIAVARSRAVGVDIERWDESVDYDGLAEFCFSRSERATLAALSPADKAAGFFAAWTRKEAYIKATGSGITQGLDHFDVSLTPGIARLECDRREPDAPGRWTMRDLAPGAGYSGAVIAEGASYGLRRFAMTPLLEGCPA